MRTCPNCGMKETRTMRDYEVYECGTSLPTQHDKNPMPTSICIYAGGLLKRALEAERQLQTDMKRNMENNK